MQYVLETHKSLVETHRRSYVLKMLSTMMFVHSQCESFAVALWPPDVNRRRASSLAPWPTARSHTTTSAGPLGGELLCAPKVGGNARVSMLVCTVLISDLVDASQY